MLSRCLAPWRKFEWAGRRFCETQILQKMKIETESLMSQLNSEKSRIYQITADGAIIERTAELRSYFQSIIQSIERLGRPSRPWHARCS